MLNNKIILGEKVELIKDEIDGAKIAIAVPKVWNKGLLIYCHVKIEKYLIIRVTEKLELN